jgi:toxin YhaV
VVYAWVNDRDTLRKAGTATDPYAVFARMLAHGNPPDDWSRLLAAGRDPAAMQRFAATESRP